MKTTVEYMDEAKKALDLPSDYALAKRLGLTPSACSNYRAGRSFFDESVALRVAEILDVNPMELLAAVNWERAKDARVKALWERAWWDTQPAPFTLCKIGTRFSPAAFHNAA